MAIRFTDNITHNMESSDFIVRTRRPGSFQILLMFLLMFCTIYATAAFMDNEHGRMIFAVTLIATVSILAWFTIIIVQRNRDLVLATEFHNAMLASAAQLSTRFCLITKRDGTIVYIDPGFQKVFPQFLQSDSHTIDAFLVAAGIPEETCGLISKTLANETGDRITLPFKNSRGEDMPMVVTIDLLPRPKGYYLFRGREYIEKRTAESAQGDGGLQFSFAMAAQIFAALPEGLLIAGSDNMILYANPLLEEWLGYAPQEMQSLQLGHICYQYDKQTAGTVITTDYQGPITVMRKDHTLATFHAYQTKLAAGDAGISISFYPQDNDVKKNLSANTQGAAGKITDFVLSSPIAVARLLADGTVLECNQPLRELTKFKFGEEGWKFIELVREDSRAEVTQHIEKILAGNAPAKKPLDLTLATDESITVSLYLSKLHAQEPEIVAQIIDTTEQKNLEQRFAHSQKMQAVGQLAGGVAHDFNNLLTAMIGFCDLLLIRHPAGDQSFADIMQVKQNANRAANLVRQLLAFSRRQTLQPKMLDVTDVLAELSNLIRRLIGENIELKVVHGRDLGAVKADQGQLEQVFINLAVNARDAMQNGGRLTVQTSHVTIDKAHPVSRSLVPPLEDEAIVDGDYVLVEVIDNGTGIPRKLMQKIFEPFFSTKEVGSGTGLGLATVYGIIKQTGGYIYVSSKEGQGTTFSLFFKRYSHEEATPVIEHVAPAANDDLTGKGTVLLVEDETPVRTFAARALRNKGYTVLEADCGENAIEVMEAQGSEVDVIISDVIMPGMNGPSMIDAVAPKFPRVKVIFISGYAEDIFVKNYGSEREFNFLPKPFTLKQLASKVKEVIQK